MKAHPMFYAQDNKLQIASFLTGRVAHAQTKFGSFFYAAACTPTD
jgi:hypothetical protein